ncbi:MAG: S8 family serine peptidase [Candidatus Dojkabacteria bacterium]|nr:MAG: S8 family serine peptidase [Candidatus Dojkabacteria bacterium]
MKKFFLLGAFVATLFTIGALDNKFSLDVLASRDDIASRASVEEMLSRGEYSSKRVRVVYKDDLEKRGEDGFFKVVSTVTVHANGNDSDYLANTAQQKENVGDTLLELMEDPEVAYAAPDYLGKIAAWTDNGTQAYPGDYDVTGPTFNQWYYNSGKVKEMWHDQGCPGGASCGGDSSVVVAVIDTGLAYGAFDDDTGDGFTENNFLAVADDVPNLYVNAGETASNGMDDDCNGVIDDAHGMDTFAFAELEITDIVATESLSERTCNGMTPVDFSGTSNTFRRKPGHPVDTYGHGTFVTGLIAGGVDNGGDTVSPAFNVSIMPLAASINTTNNTHTSQTYDESDYHLFWMADVQTAIEYAGVNGADVVNMSIGGFPFDQVFQDQIDYWYGEGMVFVAASGNDSTSGSMQAVSYPAAFDNVLAVGAVNADNTRSDYSNGGSNLDLVAYVGEGGAAGTAAYQETLTCYGCTSAGDGGGVFTGTATDVSIGTSFAAPQVAAAAAIIKSNNPTMTASNIESILLMSVQDITSYGVGRDNTTGYGVLDFQLANDYHYYIDSTLYQNGGRTSKPVASAEFNSRFYQAIKGFSTNFVYLRSTADGVFDNSEAAEDWVQIPGQTPEQINLVAYDPGDGLKLYMTVKGNSGSIYVRYTSNGSTWTDWTENGGLTSTTISSTVFNSRLFQSIRGISTNNIYVRSSGDGLFDGLADGSSPDTLENWTTLTGQTPSVPEIAAFDGEIYMTVRGNSSSIFTRSSSDGVTWGDWTQNGGFTSATPSMVSFDGRLFQSVKGNSTNYLFIRYSNDGITWYPWERRTGTSPQRTNISYFSVTDELFETVIGNSGYIFLRTYTY